MRYCGTRPPPRLLRTQAGCALQPETRDPRIRWDGPRARRALDQGRPASEHGEAGVAGWPSPAGTTQSPESPTAWASFATGVNPGKHNIYDFLVRDTNTYLPDLGMVRREPPKFLFNYLPIARPHVLSIRGGTSFWVTAGRAGVRSSVLTVPVTFPPEDVPNGELLAGLPLPDIRGTMGTFYYFATDLSRYEEGNTEFGGILKRLVMENDVAHTELVGPPNPMIRQKVQAIRKKGTDLSDRDRTELAELQAQEDVRLPMTIAWNRVGQIRSGRHRRADAHSRAGQDEPLGGPRVPHQLPGSPPRHGAAAADESRQRAAAVHLAGQLEAGQSAGADVVAGVLLRRSLQGSSATTARWDGPKPPGRSTRGAWTSRRSWRTSTRRSTIARTSSSSRLAARNWDVLVGVIESTDRVQHMMWRLIDDKHPMYDAALAAKYGDSILQRLPARRSVRRRRPPARRAGHRDPDRFGSRLPLVAKGRQPEHLAGAAGLHGPPGAAAGREEARRSVRRRGSSGKTLTGRGPARTPWGSGQIYFNLRGRESKGIVSPGAEASGARRRDARAAPDSQGPRRRVAHRPRGLQTRRCVFGGIPAECVGAAGRHGGRVSRLLANGPRRHPARHRVPEHEEVERRPRRV